MVETVNKHIKYDFLYWNHFQNFEALEKFIPILMDQYNNKPHSSLFGFTPKEVFNGIIPSKENFKTMFQHKNDSQMPLKWQAYCMVCQD